MNDLDIHASHKWETYDAGICGGCPMICKGCDCAYLSDESFKQCPTPYISFLQLILNWFKHKPTSSEESSL